VNLTSFCEERDKRSADAAENHNKVLCGDSKIATQRAEEAARNVNTNNLILRQVGEPTNSCELIAFLHRHDGDMFGIARFSSFIASACLFA